MKRNELKKILKPLIRQCIKEVIFEEGVLSNIITEVVRGTQPLNNSSRAFQKPQIQEPQNNLHSESQQQEIYQERWKQQQERKRKLLDATGFAGVDLFEGTEPLSQGGSLNESANTAQGALSGMAPGDPGVDISGIMAIGGKSWNKLAKG